MSNKIIAILRGIVPDESIAVTESIIEKGIHRIEVPLNSPNAFDSISRMAKEFGSEFEIGAGTVITSDDVQRVHNAGGTFIVSPNCDKSVIQKTKELNMQSFPGVFTITECYQALQWGADALKIFPASIMGPSGISAIRAVLPEEAQLYAVGGVTTDNMAIWLESGINGFGIGSSLYKPGNSVAKTGAAAESFVTAFNQVNG